MFHAGTRVRPLLLLLGTLAIGSVAGCSSEPADGDTTQSMAPVSPGTGTLADQMIDVPQLAVTSDLLSESGLLQLFNGVGAYTIFAPENDVFADLGESGRWLRQPEQRPVMVAILRDHIVPGYVTPADIAAALAGKASVEMQTMGGHTLRFRRDEAGIAVTGEDGATAYISGDAVRGSNGAAIPVNGLLKPVPPVP